MNAMILTMALVLGGGAESLTAVKVGALSLKAPSAWTATDADDENGKGKNWDEPGKAAKLELSVYKVDPRQQAQACLDKLMVPLFEKMGKDGWDKLPIGGEPAVRKVTTDFVGEGEAAKTDANKVSTVTYVGCNGSTKWVMSMTSTASKSARFGAVLKAVVGSIAYEK